MLSRKVKILPIFFLVLLVGCANSGTSTTQSTTSPTTKETTAITPISTRNKKYIWPNSSIINTPNTNITIEVKMYRRDTCLRIDVTAYGFKWPEYSIDNHMVREINIFDDTTTNLLAIVEVGRGGGGGGEGLDAETDEMYLYDVKSNPIPNYITAIITFDNIFNLLQPARFTLNPINRPNMQCPQLPATTPEG
jgi:hypothetical protein